MNILKNTLLIILLFVATKVLSAPDPLTFFKISVNTNNLGETSNNKFKISTYPGSDYLYSVDCDGDDIMDVQGQISDFTCVYPAPGIYQIGIVGDVNEGEQGFPRIYFNDSGDKLKIIGLEQWGSSEWLSLNSAFWGTSNMIVNATDKPNFGMLESMESMFQDATLANPNTSLWETVNVSSMKSMFEGANSANPDTSSWNTSNVVNMSYMFSNAISAKPNTSIWSTGNVINMSYMFYLASNANPNTSSWDTSKVERMEHMFDGAVSAITDTAQWETSKVTHMSYMFQNTPLSNPNTSLWNTTNVVRMEHMFDGALNAMPDTSQWITANVQEMSAMFRNAEFANPDTRNWDIVDIRSIAVPFHFHNGFALMFHGIKLSTANYDNILNNFASQNIRNDLEFDGGNSNLCTAVSAKFFLENNKNWTMTDAGQNCSSAMNDFVIVVKTDNIGSSSDNQFTIPAFTDLGGPNYQYNVSCLDNGAFNAGGLTGSYTCNYTSPGTYRIRIVDASGNGTGFPRIYFNNSGDKLKILDVRQWGTGQWDSSMKHAFWGASNLIITAKDVPDFSNVTVMQGMFRGATRVNPETLNWDVSNVEDMRRMFAGAQNASPDTNLWNTSMVEDMSLMFWQAYSANPDMGNWNVGNINTMHNMFVDVTLPIVDYDAALINFEAQLTMLNVNLNAGNSKYCDGLNARANLIANQNWNIADMGQECTPEQPQAPEQLTSPVNNTPLIRIYCDETGNEMKIYLTGSNGYVDELVGSFICSNSVQEQVNISTVVPDGVYTMTATSSKHGDESAHSNSPPGNVQIDTMVPDPVSIILNPNPATNGTQVFLQLFQIEWMATVSIVGMDCSPNPADEIGLVDCTGIVGQNGLDGTDNIITIIDNLGNINTNNSTGLMVVDSDLIFANGFE